MFLFEDRFDAGKQLASLVQSALKTKQNAGFPVVYALPRGGIPVAVAIASELRCPLSVLVSKKISLPSNPELAIGAITAEGDLVWGSYTDQINSERLEQAQEQAYEKACQQWEFFASLCPKINCQGAIAIIVDDGIATGLTMAAAALSLKKYQPQEIWLAAPVAPPRIMGDLKPYCDRLIVLTTPDPFFNVGRFYLDFPQVPTAEAVRIFQSFPQP